MKYGRIPGSVTDTKKPEPSQKMKILKASVAFFGISFFVCLFIALASIGFNIDTDFPMVNVTENYFKFDTSNNTSNDTSNDTLNGTLDNTSNDTFSDTSFTYNTTVVQGTPKVKSQFQCQFWSIPSKFRCDGITHCVPDGSDEQDCPEAPTIPSPTSISSIEASAITNDRELRVEFKNKKEAWKSKHNSRVFLVSQLIF